MKKKKEKTLQKQAYRFKGPGSRLSEGVWEGEGGMVKGVDSAVTDGN